MHEFHRPLSLLFEGIRSGHGIKLDVLLSRWDGFGRGRGAIRPGMVFNSQAEKKLFRIHQINRNCFILKVVLEEEPLSKTYPKNPVRGDSCWRTTEDKEAYLDRKSTR